MPARPSRADLLFVLVLLAGAAHAGAAAGASPVAWTRIGPEGGSPCALAPAPSRSDVVYAGFEAGGVFRSTDRGATWSFAGAGIGVGMSACTLAVDAATPALVYAGTLRGLLRSRDGGASWSLVSAGLTGRGGIAVAQVAADPRRAGVVWFSLVNGPLFRSTDGGTTWARPGATAPGNVTALAVEPLPARTVWAGTATRGLFVSRDGGASWSRLGAAVGLPANSLSRGITVLAVDPRDARALYLATGDGLLFRSGDGGATWSRGTGLDTAGVLSLAVDAGASSTAYAATAFLGLYRSTDGGRHWQVALAPGNARALTTTPYGLVVATLQGIFVSADHAGSWRPGKGLSATFISRLAIDDQDPPRLYAADLTLQAAFKSADRGGFWLRLGQLALSDEASFPASAVLAIDPRDPLRVYAAFGPFLGLSDNGGRAWTTARLYFCDQPSRLLVDPGDSAVLYLSVDTIEECGPPQCFGLKSVDRGTTWSCLASPALGPLGARVLAIDPFATSHLYAVSGADLYDSADAGATWSLLAPGLLPAALAVDPQHAGVLYAAQLRGVSRSADGGATWGPTQPVPTGSPVIAVAVDPRSPSTIYAASAGGVFRSDDAGTTWRSAAPGLEDVTVLDLRLDPVDSSILYAATAQGGIMTLRP